MQANLVNHTRVYRLILLWLNIRIRWMFVYVSFVFPASRSCRNLSGWSTSWSWIIRGRARDHTRFRTFRLSNYIRDRAHILYTSLYTFSLIIDTLNRMYEATYNQR